MPIFDPSEVRIGLVRAIITTRLCKIVVSKFKINRNTNQLIFHKKNMLVSQTSMYGKLAKTGLPVLRIDNIKQILDCTDEQHH